MVTKPIKEAILRKATTPELREIAIKEGFQTMQDMGRRMIATGDLKFQRIRTSFSLLNRVINLWNHSHTKVFQQGKYIEGEIEALNQDEASHKLKEQKVIITNLVRAKKKKGAKKELKKKAVVFLIGKKKVKVEEIVIFSKQFATMVKAGLPILEVLGMLRDQLESPAIKEVIEDIRKSLEGGVTLSKCFEKYPQYFDNVYVNLIRAGEASGKLDIFLLKIVESLEKKEKIKKKIKGALMYPG